WILSRLQATIRETTASFEQFRLDEGAKRCFEFAWKELADWYVEAVKPRLAAVTGAEASLRDKNTQSLREASAPVSAAVLAYCFDTVLRLLHPVVPFITEELWQKLPGRTADELLVVAAWPAPRAALADAAADQQFPLVQETISSIRMLRAEYRVPPKARLAASVQPKSERVRRALAGERETILRLARLLVVAGLGACANQGPPPGGPPDKAPPQVVRFVPESGAVLPGFKGDAVIQFDEVIDEMPGGGARGGGGGGGGGAAPVNGLAGQIVLSPVAGDVHVSWHRSAIHVKPAEGWKPNRVYHLELLPGIVDLRRNILKQGKTAIFSTGAPLPHAALAGTVLQWVEQ